MHVTPLLTRAMKVIALLALAFGIGFATRQLAIDPPLTTAALPMVPPIVFAPLTLFVLGQ